MSRRTIALISVFFGGLVIANVLVLAIWLPHRNNNPAQPAAPKVATSAPGGSPTALNTSSAPPGPNQPNNSAGEFAVERQVPSASGNLRIKYLRDRKTKTRRIAVEDAHRSDGGTVLCESKRTIWALISPDDQWIAVQERGASGDGSVKLYHRSSDGSAQFAPVQAAGPTGLQDTIWKAYLAAVQADPNTPLRGATIDANAWESDSRKLDLSVVYLAGANNQEVPAPWSCTYDVTSRQIEPVAAPPGSGDNEEADAPQPQQVSQQPRNNTPFPDNGDGTGADEAADNAFPGERFAATRFDELDPADVNESSLEDINYAINEMYARHGAEFKDRKVAGQFSQFSWYKLRPGLSLASAEAEFTDLEKQNMKVLRQCRDAKTAVTRHKSPSSHAQRTPEEGTGEKVLRGLRMWQDAGSPMPPHP
jgi:hypothetical protein